MAEGTSPLEKTHPKAEILLLLPFRNVLLLIHGIGTEEMVHWKLGSSRTTCSVCVGMCAPAYFLTDAKDGEKVFRGSFGWLAQAKKMKKISVSWWSLGTTGNPSNTKSDRSRSLSRWRVYENSRPPLKYTQHDQGFVANSSLTERPKCRAAKQLVSEVWRTLESKLCDWPDGSRCNIFFRQFSSFSPKFFAISANRSLLSDLSRKFPTLT